MTSEKTWAGIGNLREGETVEGEWELDALGHRVPRGTREILERREHERLARQDGAARKR